MKLLIGLLLLVAGIYLAVCAALFFMQRSLIYYPQPASVGTVADRIKLAADGAEVQVSVRPREGTKALIYFGGNAEDVSASLAPIAAAFPDRSIFLMHYRGYGGSTGSPTEQALHADAKVLFDLLNVTQKDIVVIGRSLGSGVAVRLAAERPVSRLVLVTPYDSIESIAASQFPYLPIRWLLRDKFNSGSVAGQVKVPTLIVVAERDEQIPRASTDQLFMRFAPGVARFEVVPGTTHNTISDQPIYDELLKGTR
ncbi:MAG: alpha/beta hydrolase [Pseudomonadota bacterium]